jgi:hypothetical protein
VASIISEKTITQKLIAFGKALANRQLGEENDF